jgi:hypothetical protein
VEQGERKEGEKWRLAKDWATKMFRLVPNWFTSYVRGQARTVKTFHVVPVWFIGVRKLRNGAIWCGGRTVNERK